MSITAYMIYVLEGDLFPGKNIQLVRNLTELSFTPGRPSAAHPFDLIIDEDILNKDVGHS